MSYVSLKYYASIHSRRRRTKAGKVVLINTNLIEGAWIHAKQHFWRLSGTQASQWEGHLTKKVWRC